MIVRHLLTPALRRGLALALTCCLCLPVLPAAAAPGRPARVSAVLKGHTEAIYSIAYTPDGKYVVTGSFDKTLKIWDAVNGKEVKTIAGGVAGHQNLVLTVSVSPDSANIASGSS